MDFCHATVYSRAFQADYKTDSLRLFAVLFSLKSPHFSLKHIKAVCNLCSPTSGGGHNLFSFSLQQVLSFFWFVFCYLPKLFVFQTQMIQKPFITYAGINYVKLIQLDVLSRVCSCDEALALCLPMITGRLRSSSRSIWRVHFVLSFSNQKRS